MVRVFANGPVDLGSIPGRVIPKTQKMVLDASLINTANKVGIKGKIDQPGKGVAPSPTPWCSSYRKGEPSGHPRLRSTKVLPIRARVDLGTMAMKEYSAFPKAPALLQLYNQIV